MLSKTYYLIDFFFFQETVYFYFYFGVCVFWVFLLLVFFFFQINFTVSAELLTLLSLFPPSKHVLFYLKFWIIIQVK